MKLVASWLEGTGQRWKMVVMYVLTIGGVFMTLSGFLPSVGKLITQDRGVFHMLCALYGPLWIGWFALAVRCPNCKARPGWWYLNNAGLSKWFTGFVSSLKCPVCGYVGQDVRPDPR